MEYWVIEVRKNRKRLVMYGLAFAPDSLQIIHSEHGYSH